jgi:hypothetical protein
LGRRRRRRIGRIILHQFKLQKEERERGRREGEGGAER